MPVRGKILNAFNNPIDKILANEECAGIFTVIGGGYGKNFDLSKVVWNIVGCLADADKLSCPKMLFANQAGC